MGCRFSVLVDDDIELVGFGRTKEEAIMALEDSIRYYYNLKIRLKMNKKGNFYVKYDDYSFPVMITQNNGRFKAVFCQIIT